MSLFGATYRVNGPRLRARVSGSNDPLTPLVSYSRRAALRPMDAQSGELGSGLTPLLFGGDIQRHRLVGRFGGFAKSTSTNETTEAPENPKKAMV